MNINGKDYGLLLTVAAASEIAKSCPDENFKQLNELLFSPSIPVSNNAIINMVCALSLGYEARRTFDEPGYTPAPLTRELLSTLSMLELWQLRGEAIQAFNAGLNTTVKVADSKKKRKSRQIKLNLAWFLFYGRRLGMSKREILCTTYSEMLDMIACFAIYHGAAPKKKPKKLSYAEIMEVI